MMKPWLQMTPQERMVEASRQFHEHLDRCRQCEQNPFDLCPEGAVLLQAAAAALNDGPGSSSGGAIA